MVLPVCQSSSGFDLHPRFPKSSEFLRASGNKTGFPALGLKGILVSIETGRKRLFCMIWFTRRHGSFQFKNGVMNSEAFENHYGVVEIVEP